MGEVMTEYGQVDALVTAAGWGPSGSVEDTAIPLAKAQLETNFWGHGPGGPRSPTQHAP